MNFVNIEILKYLYTKFATKTPGGGQSQEKYPPTGAPSGCNRQNELNNEGN